MLITENTNTNTLKEDRAPVALSTFLEMTAFANIDHRRKYKCQNVLGREPLPITTKPLFSSASKWSLSLRSATLSSIAIYKELASQQQHPGGTVVTANTDITPQECKTALTSQY